jgi:hypothetical protein
MINGSRGQNRLDERDSTGHVDKLPILNRQPPGTFIFKVLKVPSSKAPNRKSLLSRVVTSFLDCVIAMIGAGAVDYCRHVVHSSTNQEYYRTLTTLSSIR